MRATPSTGFVQEASTAGAPGDEQVVERILAGDRTLFELIMRRYNQRLYRVIRGILGRDAEVEDALQDAYVDAYTHLHQFRGEAHFATWLTRIAVHRAVRRCSGDRRMMFVPSVDNMDHARGRHEDDSEPSRSLEQADLRATLTAAMDRLPAAMRTVVMLRDVEGLSTRDAAACLDISEGNVRVQLHRAREALRQDLDARVGEEFHALYHFGAERCDRLVADVMRRITECPLPQPGMTMREGDAP